MGLFNNIMNIPIKKAIIKLLTNIKIISFQSFFPSDWAISPTVPMRKKPKLQKIIVTTDVAILIAARNFSLLKWPIKPVSTNPTSGIAKLEKNIGIDNLNK